MTTLRATPFNLSIDYPIVARISATNARGTGPYSSTVTGLNIQTEPKAMTAPTRNTATSTVQIVVDWVAPTGINSGRSAIVNYELQWDYGTSGAAWQSLTGVSGPFLFTSYQVSTSVVQGVDYQFKIRAQNMWGWGAYSTPSTIRASSSPQAVDAPTTTIDPITGGVKVSWNLPLNNGNTVTGYRIEILQAKALITDPDVFSAETVNCNGLNSAIISQRFCIIPMSVLTAAPFNLVFDQLVQA